MTIGNTLLGDRKKHMPRSAQVGLEDSIAATLGMLYERKERGTTLIRVLEDYRRFKATHKPMHRASRIVNAELAAAPQNELEQLRQRRAALEQVIRSIEAYSAIQASA
jgi:hypothetical protein